MKRGVVMSVDVDKRSDEIMLDVNIGVNQDYTVPLRSSGKGIISVPEEGDHVILYDEGDGKRAAMHPSEGETPPPPLPDISEGETAIVVDDNTKIVISSDGELRVDADTIKLGDGGTALLKDVTVSTTEDADGHVTSVSLNKTRSGTSETE